MRKLFFGIGLVFASSALASCGSQDYGPVSKSNERNLPITEGSRESTASRGGDWREKALGARSSESEIQRGAGTTPIEALGLVPEATNCPADSFCIRGAFFGEEQLSKLSLRFPGLITLAVVEQVRIYVINQIPTLIIDSDLFEVPEGVELRFCGKKLSIVTSEMLGIGSINSSPEEFCDPTHNDAADIQIVTAKTSKFSVSANGRNGKDGRDGVVSWEEGKDGDPQALKLDVSMEKAPIHLALDSYAFIRSVPASFGAGSDDAFLQRVLEAERLAKKSIKYLNALGLKTDELIRMSEEFNLAYKNSDPTHQKAVVLELGGGGCFLFSDPAVGNGHSGFVQSLNPKIVGLEKLNGEDAQFKSEGEDGGNGGDAGHIQVTSMDMNVGKVESTGGSSGKAGKSFVQSPGRGVSPSQSTFAVGYDFEGFLSCEEIVVDGKGERYCFRPFSTEIKFIFKLGETYALNADFKPGKPLGYPYVQKDGSVRGIDGKEIVVRSPKAGVAGKSTDPQLKKAPLRELVLNDLAYACDRCDVPKALKD